MTIELTVTAKGQVTLRKSVLEHLGVKPGDRLSVSMRGDGRVELQPVVRKADISALRGILHRPGAAPISLEEMQDAIEEGAVARYRRSFE
jgi:AbrB family looped-hinge helix DNA binding protein